MFYPQILEVLRFQYNSWLLFNTITESTYTLILSYPSQLSKIKTCLHELLKKLPITKNINFILMLWWGKIDAHVFEIDEVLANFW